MTPGTRTFALSCLAGAALVLVIGRVAPEAFAGVRRMLPDFGVYYACAQVNARGHNPYEGDAQAAAQEAVSTDLPPMRANSGPWTLAVVTPFAGTDFGAARVAWLAAELGLLVFAGGTLWKLYSGNPAGTTYGWVFAVCGYAALQALTLGQTSPLVLAGLVGFAAAERAGRRFLAGVCLSLLLVKPQNQLVVAGVLALWVVHRRQWQVVAGAFAAGAGLAAVAVAGNPHTFVQYFDAMAHRPPTTYLPPLPATVLRLAFGEDRYWLTFLPLAPAAGWGTWYYARHRHAWDWADRLPLLLLVSYLASPYGWAYDQVVFLFPLVQVAAAASRRPGHGVLGCSPCG
jgi:Glycosyltransferase family 87